MTTKKTPLPTLLRRFALITVAVTMLAVPLFGCVEDDFGRCPACYTHYDEAVPGESAQHALLDCKLHRRCQPGVSKSEELHKTVCGRCDGRACDENHTWLACGMHSDCRNEFDAPTLDHSRKLTPCSQYDCIEGHDECSLCNECLCTGTHGDTVCNNEQGAEDKEPDTPPAEQPEEPETPKEPEKPEPVVAIPYCSHCHQTIDAANAHRAPCGDHYTCDAGYVPGDHAPRTDCAHFMCQYGDHYPCDYCGGMLCAGDHGFYSCDFMHTNCPNSTADDAYTHQKLGCGYHWDCDDTAPEGTHNQLDCGCCSAWTDHFMNCEHYGTKIDQ